MSCYGCQSEFGLFKKEVGCGTCGFSFCSKCCSKKTVTSATGEISKQVICNKCCNKLSGTKATSSRSISPPLAHKKRIAAFSMGKHSMSMDTGSQMRTADYSWQNEKDKEIAERLQRLKRERNKELPPSQGEIEERLAKLKGMDPSKYSAPPIMVYRPSDKRTSIEQASDLMKQIEEEIKIDSTVMQPEDEIAIRLARLKGQEPPPKYSEDEVIPSVYREVQCSNQAEMDIDEENKIMHTHHRDAAIKAAQEISELRRNVDYKNLLQSMEKGKETETEKSEEDIVEENEANMLIEKLLSVNMENDIEDPESLEGGLSSEKASGESDDNSPEEFPWCVICTEDAKMRCFGCDGDLYCMRCFRECHDSLDIKDHKTCPFLFPKM